MEVKEFVWGCIFGFLLGFLIQHTYASYHTELNMGPKVENVQRTQGGVSVQTVYYEGKKYIVFTSGYSSMTVIKQ